MSPAMFLRCLIWKHRRSSLNMIRLPSVILFLLMDWPFMLEGFAFINPTNCESNISTVTYTCFKRELSFSCLNTLHSWSSHIKLSIEMFCCIRNCKQGKDNRLPTQGQLRAVSPQPFSMKDACFSRVQCPWEF